MTKRLYKFFAGIIFASMMTVGASASQDCTDKLFNVTISDSLTIGDAIDNLAQTCGLTVIVKDSGAQYRMKKKLYYVKLNNATLKSFLDTVLKDNDLNYTLKGNKLSISYLVTRTFKVHYVAGQRVGTSTSNVRVAGGSPKDSDGKEGGVKGSTITITTDNEFHFWSNLKDEIHRILNTAGDGSIHFTKVGNAWIGPDGQKWEYNPLEPIVDPEAGMVTVTGTVRQIERVSRYISSLMQQIKTEVMIDVRILDVRLDNGKSTGIDWSKIYDTQISLQGKWNLGRGTYVGKELYGRHEPYTISHGSSLSFGFDGDLTGLIKFLQSQGDVTVVSSPKVMTLNNQPAMISVGKEIFYKLTTTNKVGGSDTATSQDETVDSVFSGILLDITPEVDSRGLITLRINPSITSLDDASQNSKSLGGVRTMPPDLRRRQIASVIKVRDGDHAVLGGLITKSKGTKSNKVPLLGDIPVLGKAFSRDEVIDYTDELVIIITPHIIRNNRNVSLKDLGYKSLR